MMTIGQHVSHYRILQKLGKGGMGVVYKAEDTVLKRTVALKFFQPELMASEDSRSRLVREARAASNLDHPNICTIHQIEEAEDGRLFICMSYCEGDTLRNRIRSSNLKIVDKVDIAIQIAEGLAHAHEHGIVHRDIKPENVIIGDDGRARIMDFGLAKLVGQSTVLKTGTVAGTLPYMSPEQVKGGDVDHRSDIWAMGAVLYDLLTGVPPFAGDYEAAVLYSIANERAVPPTDIRPGIPQDLEEIILRALEKDPRDRYQSMQDMLEELKSVRSALTSDEGPKMTGTGRRFIRKRTRRRIMFAALVSIVAAASVLVLVSILGVDTNPVTVAVLDFENDTGEEGFDKILANLLTTDLAQTPKVRVLGRERMTELQEELNIEEVDESTGFELAKRAGVQLLISGKAVKLGERIRVDASVYDVQTKELLFARDEEGDGPDAVFEMIDDLSRNIREGIKVVPRWERDGEPSLSQLTTGSVEAYRLYSKGMDLRTSQPLQAVEFLKQAVTFDPEFAEAFIELTLLYKYQLGDYDSALSSARRVRELSRNRSAKEHLKSLIYESWVNEDWERLTDHMREYLEWQPNDMRIQRRLGWVLAQRESTYEEAISQFQKVIDLDPDDVSGELSDVYNHLGNLYMYRGRSEAAIAALEQYRLLKPGRPDPLHSLGNAYLLSGRYKEAIEQFSYVLVNHPRYYITHESLGLTYLAMGRWREALSSFRRHLTVVPEDYLPEGHMRIAEVYCIHGEYVIAENEIEKALKLDSGSVRAHWLRGIISLKGGTGLEEAREDLETIEGLLEDPRAASKISYLHHLRGRISLAERKTEEGLRALRSAVSMCQRFDSYYFERELARGHLDVGRPNDAIEVASALLKRNPNDGETLCLMALAFEQKGNDGEMVGYLNRARQVWMEADADFKPLNLVLAKLE